MTNAGQLVQQIRGDLQSVDREILEHRYLSSLNEGSVSNEGLLAFLGHQYHILASDLRSISLIVSRHGALPSRPFLMGVLQGEAAALDAIPALAQALATDIETLERYESTPEGHAYCLYMAWLGMYGSDAELASALLVNFPAWGANCGKMSKALRERYGVDADATTFLDLFANLPPFEDVALDVIQGGLDRGVAPSAIHRSARLLQSYELMFWDAMASAAGL